MSLGNILMVEPNPGILIVARNVLARAGYGVLAVSNARQGVKLCAQRPIEVLLLDAQQASADVMAALRGARHPTLQVILTVQKGRGVMTLEALESSRGPSVAIEDILEKPFTPERLLTIVDTALERVSDRRDLPDATLVNVDAMPFEEQTHESLKTDIFPFAHLLQRDTHPEADLAEPSDDPFDDETRVGLKIDGASARRAAWIRAALEDEQVDPNPKLIGACVRACETVLEQEKASLITSEAPSAPESDMSVLVLAGYVGHLSIDQILQLPTSVDGPARCRLERDGACIDIYYDGLQVVFARQDNLPDGFMLGRLLVAKGVVREQDVEAVMDPRRGLKGWLGQRLVHDGRATQEGVHDALRRQTEELIFEVVRWRTGRFSLFAKEPLPSEAARAGLLIPVQHLLLEGMRRLDEWHRIEGEVGDLAAVLQPLAASQTQEVVRGLSPEDRLVLDQIDGSRTVADLVKTVARPSFEVFRTLHSLTHRNLVAVHGAANG